MLKNLFILLTNGGEVYEFVTQLHKKCFFICLKILERYFFYKNLTVYIVHFQII